ncbi:hypothetical protein T492DRAFT_865174, partial [Pavlovales sp. CCMP2436]
MPKLALLPAALARHPRLVALTLPAILILDGMQARAVSTLTLRAEAVNSHDAGHADQLRRARALPLAREHWSALSAEAEELAVLSTALGT